MRAKKYVLSLGELKFGRVYKRHDARGRWLCCRTPQDCDFEQGLVNLRTGAFHTDAGADDAYEGRTPGVTYCCSEEA